MKIVVLSSHTPSLFWFRMDMMQEFINKGHEVIALGADPETEWKDKFREHNIDYRQLYVERNGINPFKDLKTLIELCGFMKKENPNKVFTYQAKTIIYGSIAAKLNGITEVYTLIAGLGSIFRGTGIRNKILKAIMIIEYKIACRCSKIVFFHNIDDKNEFVSNGLINADKTVIINGSGVNLEKFQPAPIPSELVFLFIGRLIKDKGIVEYLEACRMVKSQYPKTRCLLVGPYDSNPSALKPEELRPYMDDGIIEYFGEQSDVRPFIAQCSTYVLPSYHEGTPKTVLEAMAMGRSIITTNAPGCRETVVNGVNGFLIPVKDSIALFEKMKWFITNQDEIKKMGQVSYQLCQDKFDVRKVNKDMFRYLGV